jgi:hypothetical protein
MTVRRSINDPWGPPVNLGPPVNTPGMDGNVAISADMRTLYFVSTRLGGLGDWDLWQAPILPVVDFNGDEIVNIADLLRLIESWGQDDPVVDVGPAPWGDSTVDREDLEVLMSYWGQEIPSPALIAHWKLDEAEGSVAGDSIRANEGTLIGGPIWQPAGGKIGGALELDGVDDGVTTPEVCNPSAGPFSVFAWVKGGAPGQVILSQAGGANWLRARASTGELVTELKGQRGGPLACSAVITDGNWHRVGLVWDGSNRVLYVDDVEAGRDTQASLAGWVAGLYISAGSKLDAGTFWSGLIDDVRVYDRAVKP